MKPPRHFQKVALVYHSLAKDRTSKYIAELAVQISQQALPIHCDSIPYRTLSQRSLSDYEAIIAIQLTPSELQILSSFDAALISIHDHFFGFLNIPQVSWDHTAIGHLCAEFFIDKGLKNFAYLRCRNDSTLDEQVHAYQEAVELTGGKVSVFSMDTPLFSDHETNCRLSQHSDFRHWITALPKPTALLIADEFIAHQFVEFTHETGISIPEEICLLSIGNDEMICGLSNPAISSVELDYRNAASEAVQILQMKISCQEVACANPHRSLEPVEIVQRRSTDANAVTNVYVSRAVNLIHEFASSGITVDEISERLKVSRSYLERSFRQQIGCSPGSEIRKTKLTLVKRLLQDTQLTIAEIAEKTGFNHQEYLYVAFKRQFHMTPLQYRKRLSRKKRNEPSHSYPNPESELPHNRRILACA